VLGFKQPVSSTKTDKGFFIAVNLSKIKFVITKVFCTFEVPKVNKGSRDAPTYYKLWAFFMHILEILYSTQKVVYHSSNRKIGSKLPL
jgi:hypothetical protein